MPNLKKKKLIVASQLFQFVLFLILVFLCSKKDTFAYFVLLWCWHSNNYFNLFFLKVGACHTSLCVSCQKFPWEQNKKCCLLHFRNSHYWILQFNGKLYHYGTSTHYLSKHSAVDSATVSSLGEPELAGHEIGTLNKLVCKASNFSVSSLSCPWCLNISQGKVFSPFCCFKSTWREILSALSGLAIVCSFQVVENGVTFS